MTRRFSQWLNRKWHRAEGAELLHAYQVTFSTPHGQLVLQHLLNEIYCQTCPTLEPIALAAHNGRRSVVQEILENIDTAESPVRFPHEQEPHEFAR